MQGIKVKIQHSGGKLDTLQIEGDRATIGSGAHCEVRLGQDQAASEHVLVTLLPSGLMLEALSFQPPPLLNESQFHRSPLTPGAVLSVGTTKLWLEAGELEQGVVVKKADAQKTSPTTLFIAAVAIPASLYVLFMDSGDDGSGLPPKAPELWGPPVAACTQQGAAAKSLADSTRVLADAHRERRPFFVQDGVKAVSEYELAAACYRAAGETEPVAELEARAKELRQAIALEFRSHRMALDHALSIDNQESAARQVRVLRMYASGAGGPYAEWLSQQDRKYRLALGSGNR